VKETINRIRLRIEKKPLCKYCGKPTGFIGKPGNLFNKYCSNSCRAKDISCHIWQQKQREYNLKHFGKECNFSIDKCQQARKETLIERYGTDYVLDVPEFKQKSEKTMQERYGISNLSESYKVPELKAKRLKTLAKNENMPSKIETDLTEWLKTNNFNFKWQYTSTDYPFSCDFYLVDYDLYVEIQGHWSHGPHPFDDNSEEDKKLLEKWKAKGWNLSIVIWTKRDPIKLRIAEENHVNLLRIYSIKLDECVEKIEAKIQELQREKS
jgi:hypothetical protein